MLDRLRYNALTAWARFVCTHPWLVLALGLSLAAACIVYTVTELSFQSDRNDLISAELPWNQRYIQYKDSFAGQDTVLVAVNVPEGQAGTERAKAFVATLGPRLAKSPNISEVRWAIDPRNASPKLLRLAKMDQFKERIAQLGQSGPLLKSENIGDLIQAITAGLSAKESEQQAGSALQQIQMLVELMGVMDAAAKGEFKPDMLAKLSDSGEPLEFLVTDDGRMMFIEIDARHADGELDVFGPAVRDARVALEATLAQFNGAGAAGEPQIEAGLTGIPVMEADETKMSTDDTERASMVSMVLIALLLLYAFRSWQLPVIMVVSLLIGIAWAFGYVTLAVGHLQVLSVVFTILLLGLGIDYGIHIVSRFELIRHEYPDRAPGFCGAMTNAMQVAGPGVLTGAITTAAAFSTTMLTQFTGMAEMGLISCVGVLLCLVAMLGVMPAAMRLLRKKSKHVSPVESRKMDLHEMRWLMPVVWHPLVTLSAAAVICVLGVVGMLHVRYDNNLLNLLPDNLDSVRWLHEVNKHETTIWSGIFVVDSLDQARLMTRRLEKLDVVESVGGAGRMFPPDLDEKLAMVREARAGLGPLLDVDITATKPPSVSSIKGKLGALRFALGIAVNRKDVQAEPEIHAALQKLRQSVQQTLVAMGTDEFAINSDARIGALHKAYEAWRADLAHMIRLALDPGDLVVEDLPPSMARDVASLTTPRKYQLKAYPKGDVWEPQKQGPFVAELRSIDPNVTGSPIQIYESGALMQHSYQLAGAAALVIVLVLVYLDFQQASYSGVAHGVLALLLLLGGAAVVWWLHGGNVAAAEVAGERTAAWISGAGYWTVPIVIVVLVGIVLWKFDPAGVLDAVLCLVPVAFGFVVMFGLMYVCDVSINPANIIVLPLMFGIGVASGVNIMHRYKQNRYARPTGLTQGTGKGIILTNAATIFAFATMLFAQHKGIRTLGFVLTVGITTTLVACLIVMPPILELRNRYHAARRKKQFLRAAAE